MTKKHFEKLAEYLRDSMPLGSKELDQWERDVHTVANFCTLFNHRFDRTRFLRAAGVGE